ncbi:MAG: hypothetical protein ABSG51_01015 [Terracidiphilus sp.]|jgi:hypothetical protein
MKRHLVFLILTILFVARDLPAQPQSDTRHPVVNIYVLRAAEQLQSPHVITYRVAEWEQMRGRWILPDVGYYDSGYGKDQLWLAGGGANVLHSKHLDWDQELYILQEAGPESTNKRFLWLWPVLNFRFRPRLTAQIAPYPTLPLNRAQGWSFDIDRAKIEWAATSQWKAGAGYAGGLTASSSCLHRPFLTVTRSTRAGSFEEWLQYIPGGAQVQLRYTLVRGEN